MVDSAIDTSPRSWRIKRLGLKLSRTCSTDVDRTVILVHHWELSFGRMCFKVSRQTQASVDREARWEHYTALRKQAEAATDVDTVQWALDDLWAAGGTLQTATALMHRIINRQHERALRKYNG